MYTLNISSRMRMFENRAQLACKTRHAIMKSDRKVMRMNESSELMGSLKNVRNCTINLRKMFRN